MYLYEKSVENILTFKNDKLLKFISIQKKILTKIKLRDIELIICILACKIRLKQRKNRKRERE